MAAPVERERKLEASRRFGLAGRQRAVEPYSLAPATWKRLHTVYYDTPDLRLLRWNVSFRFRAGEGWTVKLPEPSGDGRAYRTEHSFPGPAGEIPAAALDLLAAILRGVRPAPVAELRTLRTERAVHDGDAVVADVAEDDVHVVNPGCERKRFRQVEIELRADAPERVLAELSRSLRRAGAGPREAPAKIAVAMGERSDRPEVPIPELGANATGAELVRAALAASVRELVCVDVQLRSDPSSEAIHDARVAVRRLRSHLRTFRKLLHKEWSGQMRERLGWLGDILSGARDADVLLGGLEREAGALPAADRRALGTLLEPFRDERASAHRLLADTMRSPRYVEVVDAAIAAAREPQFRRRAYDCRAADLSADVLRGPWKRLRRAVRESGATPHDRQLHAIRIKGKHVRYAAEALVPICGKPAKRFAQSVERLQNVLGDQHDAVTAYQALCRLQDDPQRAFLAGELAARELAIAGARRNEWRRCWKRAKREARRMLG